jgi:valyl-tRNA synthetase
MEDYMMNEYEQKKNDMIKEQTRKNTKFEREDYLKNHPEDVIGEEAEYLDTVDEEVEK